MLWVMTELSEGPILLALPPQSRAGTSRLVIAVHNSLRWSDLNYAASEISAFGEVLPLLPSLKSDCIKLGKR
jgi:hypothetical protein